MKRKISIVLSVSNLEAMKKAIRKYNENKSTCACGIFELEYDTNQNTGSYFGRMREPGNSTFRNVPII